MEKNNKELSLDELREVFSRPLDPKLKNKVLKKGFKLNLKDHPAGEPYPKKVLKFALDNIRAVLGRYPTDGEMQNILMLWKETREAEEQAAQ